MSPTLLADEAGHGRPPPPVLQKPPGFRDPQQGRVPPVSVRTPVRKAPLPQAFRQAGKATSTRHRRRNRSICRRCCCCFFLFIVCLLFLLALAGAVCYLYLQPHLPMFRLQSVQTPKFNVTTRSDGSGTLVDAATVIKIFASNQNGKIVFSYGESNAAVYVPDDDGDVSVGSGWMAGFVQGKRNATVMKFTAELKGALVDDAVGTRLRSRFRSKEIRFGVEVMTKIGLGLGSGGGGGGRMTWRVPIRVDCPPVSLKQVKDAGILPKCGIYLFRWINIR